MARHSKVLYDEILHVLAQCRKTLLKMAYTVDSATEHVHDGDAKPPGSRLLENATAVKPGFQIVPRACSKVHERQVRVSAVHQMIENRRDTGGICKLDGKCLFGMKAHQLSGR